MHLMMTRRERRQPSPQPDDAALRSALTPAQCKTLGSLEYLGWTLEFVRHQLFQESIAVVCDSEEGRRVLLESSGMLNENFKIAIRE